MQLTLPVMQFQWKDFPGTQEWIDMKINDLEKYAPENKGVPVSLFYLSNINDNIIEYYIDLTQCVNTQGAKDLLSAYIPEHLNREQAFACLMWMEAWIRDSVTNKIKKEAVIIQCETLNESILYTYDVDRTDNSFLLKNKQRVTSLGGRLADFLRLRRQSIKKEN